MIIIGITGGIGTGKSTVSLFLAELGAVIIDADKVGHEAFQPETELWKEVVNTFGTDILKPDRKIDRKKLAEIVFNNDRLLSRLNEIMHPRLYEIVKLQIENHRRLGTEAVVLEASLLIEANWISLVDEIWVTVAPRATVLKRLTEKGMSESEAIARINAQSATEEKMQYADVLINTDCSLDELRTRVRKLWERTFKR